MTKLLSVSQLFQGPCVCRTTGSKDRLSGEGRAGSGGLVGRLEVTGQSDDPCQVPAAAKRRRSRRMDACKSGSGVSAFRVRDCATMHQTAPAGQGLRL